MSLSQSVSIKHVFKIAFIVFAFYLNAYSSDLKVNANVFNFSRLKLLSFVADKSTKTAYLIKIDNDSSYPEVIEKVKILIGKNHGDKIRQGDMKTPEGVYFIKRFIPGENLSKIYGIGAFVLDYPNPSDIANHKTGYGIWIHGLPDNSSKKSTKGCIALKNEDLEKLKEIFSKDFPVVISGKSEFVDKFSYDNLKSDLKALFFSFIDAWESGDFERFSSFFSEKFCNLKKYLEFKRYLFKRVKFRKIIPEKLRVFRENGHEMVYVFNQLYCASNLLAYGEKKLYFENGKIVAEKYTEKNATLGVKKYVEAFIYEWKKSWENKDISSYKRFYSQSFPDLFQWLKGKEDKFSRYSFIKVKIENLKFRVISPTTVKVSFIQRFESDLYRDVGKKVLIIKGCPGNYKIVREIWSKL